MRQQKEAARVTQLAVQRFEAEVLKNQGRIFNVRQQRVLAENRINFLIGRMPAPVAYDAEALNAQLPTVLSTGVPSDLLANRPDVRAAELQLQQPHVVRLETRPPNLEGKGEIGMRDLLRNALRMRPDRIILGEIRGGEAIDMLQAMNTGHDGSLGTIHANRPREALTRQILVAGDRERRQPGTGAADLAANADESRDRASERPERVRELQAEDLLHGRGVDHGALGGARLELLELGALGLVQRRRAEAMRAEREQLALSFRARLGGLDLLELPVLF